MASTIVFSGLPTALTLTATSFARGSDVIIETGVSITEATNKKTDYSGTFTTASSGFYNILIYLGTDIIASSLVYAEATGTFYADATDQVVNEVTGAELTAVPTAAPSMREMLAWLYQSHRNQVAQNASSQTVSKSDGTVIGTATTTDDTVTYVKAKFGNP